MKLVETFNAFINEVSDQSNVRITWYAYDEASFRLGNMPYTVSFMDDGDGVYSVSFQGRDEDGNMTYNKTNGGNGAAVMSGVLTTIREFIENYEKTKGVKPFAFEFTAAIELVDIEDFSSEEEYNKELRRSESRPRLYKRLAEKMANKYGYTLNIKSNSRYVEYELQLKAAEQIDYLKYS